MSDGRYTYLWEYEVPPEAEAEFLAHYSPGGSWTRLFHRAAGYLSTELYRDRLRASRFLTMDHWTTEAAFREFRSRFAAEFDALDRECGRLTRGESAIGEFRPVVPAAPAAEARGPTLECTIPILRVADLVSSLRYYVDVLGFEVEWGGEHGSEMASVGCDGHSIMLCEGAQGHPGTWLWIGVTDIRPLFERYRRSGARIRQAPVSRPWAYEMQVEDLDGHVLRFGSEPATIADRG
jgi:heme-degrading monooxygenase HmoA/catechol 2,3-dioxygenase-like lactoylglutathione lyase family enzyme